MATTYTASIPLRFRKQHTCLGCGTKFSYLVDRKVSATGSTEEAALKNARLLAVKAVTADVEYRACPGCEYIQPEMVADVRSGRITLPLVCGVISALTFLGLGISQVLSISLSVWLSTAGAVIVLAMWFRAAWFHPNRSWQGSSIDVRQPRESSPDLEQRAAGGGSASAIEDGPSLRHWISVGLAVVTVVGVVSPMLMSLALGWRANPNWHPEIAGPGDEARLYFDESISSIKGMWNGMAKVEVRNPQDFSRPPTLSATTHSANWGMVISGKNIGTETHRMYVDVKIDPNPELADKTLQLQATVDATFPQQQAGGFDDAHRKFQQQASLVLSGPHSGSTYKGLFIAGHLGAVLASLVCWWLQYGPNASLRKRASQTEVLADDDVFE